MYDWVATGIVVTVGGLFFYNMGYIDGAETAQAELRECVLYGGDTQ